jgi:stearoyl-CoA desaturase (delta-9 desaturase)
MHMTELLTTLHYALVDWLVHGLSGFSGWQIVAYTLVTTHITIAAVTIVLHRSQAHRSVELHALTSHFFRCWLRLGTGIVTCEWVAVHRKHHAACETPDDPHSPQTRGIAAVLLRGSELYAVAAKDRRMLEQYGAGTPEDWLERKLYTPHSFHGVGLMLVIDLLAFGAIGATVWAVQMLWSPVSAAGIVNGIGHWWGYRNFEVADASRNIVPWGIVIGGEELHNNHHTYPTSAKLSVRRHEFDIGWAYIRGLEMLGLATVRRIGPQLRLGAARPVADATMLEAVIANRYELMANYARRMRRAALAEWLRLRAEGHAVGQLANLRCARRWLHRDAGQIPTDQRAHVSNAVAHSPTLAELVAMREQRDSCGRARAHPANNSWSTCKAWLKTSEASDSATLHEFAAMLRAVRA